MYEMRTKPLDFGGPLSGEEHEYVVQKLVNSYEEKLAPDFIPKSNVETAFNARFVICSWLRSAKYCAQQDLKEGEFKSVATAVELGSCLDAQFVAS